MVFCLFLDKDCKIIEIITPEKNARKGKNMVQSKD